MFADLTIGITLGKLAAVRLKSDWPFSWSNLHSSISAPAS
jgi:hypothetical protein